MPRNSNKQRAADARNRILREERRKLVEANYLAGASYREIAAALDVSVGTIAKDVKAIIDGYKREQVEAMDDFLQVQKRRYELLINTVWKEARSGNLAMMDRLLTIMDKMNSVTGLTGRIRPSGDDWEKFAIEDIRAGRVTYLAMAEAFDASLATRLFTEAGVPVNAE